MRNTLKTGDSVWVRGGFGTEPRALATVEQIEITNGDKYGTEVDEVKWALVYDRNVVVSLDNGHWAYAEQIKRIR
jgi:hypothetical protein